MAYRNPYWGVYMQFPTRTKLYLSYLVEDHAKRLADVMNDIEAERIERRGGKRGHGDGDFYLAKPMVDQGDKT